MLPLTFLTTKKELKTFLNEVLSFDTIDPNKVELETDIRVAYPTKYLNNIDIDIDIYGMPLATLDLRNSGFFSKKGPKT